MNMTKKITFLVWLLPLIAFCQTTDQPSFWKKVQWGGGVALNIGNQFTNVGISPTAIYPTSETTAVGLSAQYHYLRQRNFHQTHLYGLGVIGLYHPFPEMQFSAELEQTRVNRTFFNPIEKDQFWNTALFLGAGYRTGNVTVGVRYNVLFRDGDRLYGEAWMPFVRVFF